MFKEGKEEVANTTNPETGTPRVESEEKLPSMNNFHHYFPGGISRGSFGKPDRERQTKIMETIDALIGGEFKDGGFADIASRMIDIQYKLKKHADRMVRLVQAGVSVESLRTPEIENLNNELKELSESLRPIFNKLLEEGFAEAELIHGK